MDNVSMRRDNITCLLTHHILHEESFIWTNQSSFWNSYNLPSHVLSMSWIQAKSKPWPLYHSSIEERVHETSPNTTKWRLSGKACGTSKCTVGKWSRGILWRRGTSMGPWSIGRSKTGSKELEERESVRSMVTGTWGWGGRVCFPCEKD